MIECRIWVNYPFNFERLIWRASPLFLRYTMAAQDLVMKARGVLKDRGWRIAGDRLGSGDDISVFIIPLMNGSKQPQPSWPIRRQGANRMGLNPSLTRRSDAHTASCWSLWNALCVWAHLQHGHLLLRLESQHLLTLKTHVDVPNVHVGWWDQYISYNFAQWLKESSDSLKFSVDRCAPTAVCLSALIWQLGGNNRVLFVLSGYPFILWMFSLRFSFFAFLGKNQSNSGCYLYILFYKDWKSVLFLSCAVYLQ